MDINIKYVLAGTAALSTAVGFFSGYVFAIKKLTMVYNDALETELEESKQFFENKANTEIAQNTARFNEMLKEKPVLAVVPEVEEAAKALVNYQGIEPVTKKVERWSDPATKANVKKAEEFLEKSKKAKNVFDEKAKPYVISWETFAAGELDYEQYTMTWYEGDDVLVNHNDKKFDQIDTVIGRDNLQRFGESSSDPNVVYIRNEVLEFDFEVLHNPGKYRSEEAADDTTTG